MSINKYCIIIYFFYIVIFQIPIATLLLNIICRVAILIDKCHINEILQQSNSKVAITIICIFIVASLNGRQIVPVFKWPAIYTVLSVSLQLLVK